MANKRLETEFLEDDGVAITIGEKPKWAITNLTASEVRRLINSLESMNNLVIETDGSCYEEPAA